MATKFTFFRVGNGDMTLVTFDSGKTLLIDSLITTDADDPDHERADVATQLRDRLVRDDEDRPYVDAMLLSHPDQDHCCGLERHFHLGALDDYEAEDDKIVIREQWSSPIVFRRAENHKLCADAKAWAKEARRRVALFRTDGALEDGDRIVILGEDEDGKTDDLGDILVKVDESWASIAGAADDSFEALLLGPLPSGDEAEEELLSKNDSSVIVRLKLVSAENADFRFLTGGDAGVAVWERLWEKHEDEAEDRLGYDLLQTPHHCSWHSLSHDSWSELGEKAKVSKDARSALAQARDGATLLASSKPISDDDVDPPCVRAKREYEAIAKEADGTFTCVAGGGPEPLEYEVGADGIVEVSAKAAAGHGPKVLNSGLIKAQAARDAAAVRKEGGGRYA